MPLAVGIVIFRKLLEFPCLFHVSPIFITNKRHIQRKSCEIIKFDLCVWYVCTIQKNAKMMNESLTDKTFNSIIDSSPILCAHHR